jgi:hypothetical protein
VGIHAKSNPVAASRGDEGEAAGEENHELKPKNHLEQEKRERKERQERKERV